MATTLSHRGLCVRDLAASQRFYAGCFGFRRTSETRPQVGEWLDRTYGLPQSRIRACRLSNSQGVALSLTTFEQPGVTGKPVRRSLHALGPTHLNFYVPDIEHTLEDVERHGGKVVRATRTITDGTDMIYCTDPDGIRVEVWTSDPFDAGGMATAIPGVDRKFSHSGICVRSIERSLPFYEILGFTAAERFDYRNTPGLLDRMNETPDVRLLAQMVRSGNDVIELLEFENPLVETGHLPHEANRIGLVNIAFQVDDIDRLLPLLANTGGTVVQGSRSGWGDAEQIQCLDPDGTRIELWALRSRDQAGMGFARGP